MELEMFLVNGYVNNFCGRLEEAAEYYSSSLKV